MRVTHKRGDIDIESQVLSRQIGKTITLITINKKETKMDFIERLLHISPDGGSGASELMIGLTVILTLIGGALALRNYFPRSFKEFLEQLGKRENSDRFDN